MESSGEAEERDGVVFDAGATLDNDPDTYWSAVGLDQFYNDWFIVFDMGTVYTISEFRITNFGDTDHDVKVGKSIVSHILAH